MAEQTITHEVYATLGVPMPEKDEERRDDERD